MQLSLIIGVLIVVNVVESSTWSSDGSKCGREQCLVIEYGRVLDFICKPCLTIFDERNHNHNLPLRGVRDCQEYLDDQKYALNAKLGEVESLKEKVEILSTLVEVSSALIIFLTLVIIFLPLKTFWKLKKISEALAEIFEKIWIKSTKKNDDKEHNDVESSGGTVKSQQKNNTRLIMPTMSANVASTSQNPNEYLTKNTSVFKFCI